MWSQKINGIFSEIAKKHVNNIAVDDNAGIFIHEELSIQFTGQHRMTMSGRQFLLVFFFKKKMKFEFSTHLSLLLFLIFIKSKESITDFLTVESHNLVMGRLLVHLKPRKLWYVRERTLNTFSAHFTT